MLQSWKGRAKGTGIEILPGKGDKEKALMLHAAAAKQPRSMGRRAGVKSREVSERCGGGLQIADTLRLKITVPYFIKG